MQQRVKSLMRSLLVLGHELNSESKPFSKMRLFQVVSDCYSAIVGTSKKCIELERRIDALESLLIDKKMVASLDVQSIKNEAKKGMDVDYF